MPPKHRNEDQFCKYLKESLKAVEDLNNEGNNVNLQIEYQAIGGTFLYVKEVDRNRVIGKVNDVGPDVTVTCKELFDTFIHLQIV